MMALRKKTPQLFEILYQETPTLHNIVPEHTLPYLVHFRSLDRHSLGRSDAVSGTARLHRVYRVYASSLCLDFFKKKKKREALDLGLQPYRQGK